MPEIAGMSPLGYNVLRSFEGRSLRAYKDAVGVWTIGYGNTNSDASVLGFTIKAGVEITGQQAESLLKVAMEKRYAPTVLKAMNGADQPTIDASCDFVYNIGTGGFASRGWVTSWKATKNARGILAYDHAGGKVLAGLTRRRKRELVMIEKGDYGPEGHTAPVELVLDKTGKEIGVKVAPVPAGQVPGVGPVGGNVVKFPASAGMLKKGDEGPAVKDFQAALLVNGFKCPQTGVYDEATEHACAQFQSAHPQMNVDGVGGPATRAALQRGVDMISKSKRAGAAAGAVGGPVAADQTVNAAPFLPTWSVWALGIAFVVTVAYVAWQYRDEIKAYFTKSKPFVPPAAPSAPAPVPAEPAKAA